MLRRTGIRIHRATLAKWMIQVSMLTQPIVNLLIDELIASDYIHADETRAQVLKELGRKASALSWIWVYHTSATGKPLAIYQYHASRGAHVVKGHLEGFAGYLQCDGYTSYDCLDKGRVTLLGCWAHVRRKYAETIQGVKKENQTRLGHATQALRMIAQLYEMEDYCDQQNFSPQQRYVFRQLQSQPLIEKYRAWLDERLPRKISYCDNNSSWFSEKENALPI